MFPRILAVSNTNFVTTDAGPHPIRKTEKMTFCFSHGKDCC